jgi:hypothetical protein
MSPLEKLGRDVARELDQLPGADRDLQAARTGLLATRPPRGRKVALVAVALAAALALVFLFMRPRAPITFELTADGVTRAGVAGTWFSGAAGTEVPFRFSEGSTVLLAPGTRARVDELRADGATLSMERGHAAVSVSPHEHARWMFLVGPFAVRVTGTRFDTEWDPTAEVFTIVMHDGSVKVRGPTLVADRPVVAGQTLRIDLHPPSPASPDTTASAPVVSAAPSAPVPPSMSALPSTPVAVSEPRALTWVELAGRGDYAPAIDAAERVGIEGILATSGPSELILLGDSARFAGKTELARRAYMTARARFPGSASAALAAFALGRFGGSDALGWFERYLVEAPSGPLARESLGRIMEIQNRSGLRDPARATARRYLATYPGGPHAGLARALIAAEGDGGVPEAPTAP